MFLGNDNEVVEKAVQPEQFLPWAQYWPQTDRIEVTLSPRRPYRSIRQSDEIQIHLARGILGRSRVVGFTIHDIDRVREKSARQTGTPLRGMVGISTVLRTLHRMELCNKERLFGKYRGQIERMLAESRITVLL